MGNIRIDPEKIGEAVDQGKSKYKKQNPLLNVDGTQDNGNQKDGYQNNLECFYQRNIFPVKKAEEG
jgi:hypothetical protein